MDKKERKLVTSTIKRRILAITMVFILLFAVIVGRLAYLSIIQHTYWMDRASSQQLRDSAIAAERGIIYDANMNILARSATVWTVALAPIRIEEKNYDRIATFLSEQLGLEYETVLEKCKGDSYYTILKRKVDKPIVDRIQQFVEKNDIAGIQFTEDTKRYYPYGNFASQVLGFVGTDNNGLYGLESYYDTTLSGTPGRMLTAVNAYGKDMYYEHETLTEAIDGYSLVLTLDAEIQRTLENALDEAMVEHNVRNYACGIIMNVNTGAIYAMSTKPDFDPNTPLEVTDERTIEQLHQILEDATEAYNESSKDDEDIKTPEEVYLEALSEAQHNQWNNKAITDIYEPGSVFKVVTASAALETGTCSLSDEFYCSGGVQVTPEIVMHCAITGGHGQEDFTHSVINSCNPAFIEIGKRLGKTNFYNYFKAYGLTDKTGVDLPSESNSVYYTDKTMGVVELASCSFGQSNAITPIQMITAFSACVNGGYLVQPYIVGQILDSTGNIVSQHETVTKRQVISKETSDTMRDILEQVVETSNGQNAYVAGFRLGGKSGTAEKLNGREGEYVASFCAFAPADDPQVACLILLDGARSYSRYGGVIVAPIVASVMSEVLPYLGVEAVYKEDEVETVGTFVPNIMDYSLTSARAALQKRGLNAEVIGDGQRVTDQYPVGGVGLPKGSKVYVYTEDKLPKYVDVPDVNGRSVSYVKSLFESIGLNLAVDGSSSSSAVAVAQDYEPGANVREGTVITVDFVNKNIND
ncbi:MAG: PASTA domain-containing protein [Oscillospiraceae bacterium]|nr:PASTA domain-containing protein [Oscillospiraceae bacterium]MBR0451849.1 PASTA domain-containing protein [Oscillospiraceae bacterium]